jgi:hypothetical protein
VRGAAVTLTEYDMDGGTMVERGFGQEAGNDQSVTAIVPRAAEYPDIFNIVVKYNAIDDFAATFSGSLHQVLRGDGLVAHGVLLTFPCLGNGQDKWLLDRFFYLHLDERFFKGCKNTNL